MTTPHLMEPPSLALCFVDVQLSPMSRRRHGGYTMLRIPGDNAQEAVHQAMAFIAQEERANAVPVWEWIPATDIEGPKLSVRCEVNGMTFGGTARMSIMEWENSDDERKAYWLMSTAHATQQRLEAMIARFVLYGAK